MRFARLIFAALVLFAWLAPAGQAADDSAPQKKHFLWKATGGKGVVYLLGTIHVAKSDLYPLDPIIEETFKKSAVLVVEVDVTKSEASKSLTQDLLRTAIYSEDESVANHLSEKTRARLAEFAKGGQLPSGYRRY